MPQNGSSSVFPLYGFKTPDFVSNEEYTNFEVDYKNIVLRRNSRWERYFQGNVDPNKSRRLKRFCRKGIPPDIRGEIWMSISGARDRMISNSGVYQKAVSQQPERELCNVILVDIPRTYPENKYFQNPDAEEGLAQSLRRVLMAFASHFPLVGYCQGFNYVAGILLLVLRGSYHEREEKAFWLLDALFNDILPTYYTDNMVSLKRDCYVLGELLRSLDRPAYEMIVNKDINFEVLCTKWFICLYADVLPIETTIRVFDCLFYEGDKLLFRAGLTLIELHRDQLLQCTDFASVMITFRKMCRDSQTLNCHQFMQALFKLPGSLPRAKIEKLRQQYTNKNPTSKEG